MTHLRSGDFEVRSVPDHKTVVRCVTAWHYSRSAPNTSTYRHGIYPRGVLLCGDPLGVTLWIPPTRSAAEHIAGDDWQRVLSLSRLAVDPQMPTNAASFLLGRSMRMIDRDRWPVLVTYADTALGHTGAIYKATNWIEDGPVDAGDVWIGPNGDRRGRKRGGRTMTAAEMRAAGYARVPNRPKIRFRHDVRRGS